MDAWKKWVIVVAGIVSIIGQFLEPNYYLPFIGGIVAAILALIE